MNERTTLITFTYPSDLIAVKGRLESEGIKCFVRDELTIQGHNFLSNAVGGIRLDVKQSDYEKAKTILKDIVHLKPN